MNVLSLKKLKFLPKTGFLHKLRNLPEKTRKIILWSIVGIIGFVFFIWWASSIRIRAERFQRQEFIGDLEASELQEKLRDFPRIKFPDFREMARQEIKTTIEEMDEEERARMFEEMSQEDIIILKEIIGEQGWREIEEMMKKLEIRN